MDIPFGIKGDAGYLTGTVALGAGDWLVVFTDGVVEAVNEPGSDYGEERLISILNAGTETSPAKMLSRIMVDLDFFVGSLWQIGGKGVCVEAGGFVAFVRRSRSVRRCVCICGLVASRGTSMSSGLSDRVLTTDRQPTGMPLSSHPGHVSDGVCSFGSTLEQAKDGWNSVSKFHLS